MTENWIRTVDYISGGAVLAAVAAILLAGSVAVTAGRSVGPVGWAPLAAISVLALLTPFLGKQVLLEGCVTFLSGVVAFAGLMFGLQLSLIPDLERWADAAEPGAGAEDAAAGLTRATNTGAVFMVMAFTAWLVAWSATRQLARLRELAERARWRESLESDQRAHADVLAALEAMRREIETLRAEQVPARRWSRLRRRWFTAAA